MTIYLDYDLVVANNAEHCGAGAGVRNEAGVRAQLGRASQTFLGKDVHPSIAEKAAVLLHGLSSTQYFHDGNKRTAWLAMNLFLELNGAPLKQLPVVAAEALVLTVATRAFETDENGHARAIAKTAEWISQHRLRMRDRLDYAILARVASTSGEADHTFSADGAQLGGVAAPVLPIVFPLSAVVRVKFRRADIYRDWRLRVEVDRPGDVCALLAPNERARRYLEKTGELPPDFDPRRDLQSYDEGELLAFEDLSGIHDSGVTPSLAVPTILLQLLRPGSADLVFTVNGEFLARRTIRVSQMPDLELLDGIDLMLPGPQGGR